MLSSTIIDKQKLIDAYKEDITRISSDAFERALADHQRDYHDNAEIKFEDIDKNYLKRDLSNFNEVSAKAFFL